MADSAEKFATARFKVWATVDTESGVVNFGDADTGGDIVSVSATFALNTIPTATLVLATGRNAITNKLATIHTEKSKLQARDKVNVYVNVIPGVSGVKEKIRPGTYKIFEGYLAGIGYQRSHNQANYVLNLIHWLDDLNNSSAINGDWLPGAPSDYARAALAAIAGNTTSLSAMPDVAVENANANNVREDLWERTIKPICIRITEFNGLTQLPPGATAADLTNTAAQDALDRMPGNAAALGYYKPLAFRLFDGAALNFDNTIREYFRAVFGDSTAQNSFWAKIISSLSGEFMFAISPAVDWALPIPFCGGVRWQEGGAIIAADEYSFANFNTNMAQILEAVYIVYAMASGTNVDGENDTPTPPEALSFYKPYASWPTEAILKETSTAYRARGLKLFKRPPGWFNGLSAADLTALSSVDGAGLITDPGTGSERLPNTVIRTEEAYDRARDTISDFAKHWYLTEVLQQRVGELSGALRFDIAPGSIVKIITPKRDKVMEPETDHVTAAVTSVSYVINSERATAGTSFTFAHTKTQQEASGGSLYATDRPPLYTPTFYNAPLAVPGI